MANEKANEKVKAVVAAKPKASRMVTVLVGSGGSRMSIVRTLASPFKTHVTVSLPGPKGRKLTRGATEKHADEKAAQAAVARLTAKAVSIGWKEKARFVENPDRFGPDSLPKP